MQLFIAKRQNCVSAAADAPDVAESAAGPRRVRILCQQGKIEGIVQNGRSYFIPVNAVKPVDGRKLRHKSVSEQYVSLFSRIDSLKEQLDKHRPLTTGGEQQMLAVGRAMMAKPQLLLLDEPSLGLAPLIIADIFNMIQRIRDLGVTVLLVEQNARMALRISDRGYVLETGTIVMSDDAKTLLKSDVVRNAYLGKET